MSGTQIDLISKTSSVRQSVQNSLLNKNFNQLPKAHPIEYQRSPEVKKQLVPEVQQRTHSFQMPAEPHPMPIQTQRIPSDQVSPKIDERQTFNEQKDIESQTFEQTNQENLLEVREDDHENEEILLEHEDEIEDNMKDLSNPASQDYVMEKLKDMEQIEESER